MRNPFHSVLLMLRNSSFGRVFAYFRLALTPTKTYRIYRDIKKTEYESRFFHFDKIESGNKKALIVCFNGIVSGTKKEAWLGLGLRLRGWKVEALMHHSHILIMKYLKVMGIKKFHHPNHFPLTHAQKDMCKLDAKKFIEDGITFAKVKQWRYKNTWIGPYILSSLQRKERLGALDLKDPLLRQQIIDLIPGVLEWVLQSRLLLMAIKPDLIYLIEVNNHNRPLVDNAIQMGIDVIQFVQPNRDDALVFKRLTLETSRIHPNSVEKDKLIEIASGVWSNTHEEELMQEFDNRYSGKWFMQVRNQPNTVKKDKKQIIKQQNLDENKKIAVVFSHILWDANLFYGEDVFDDYADWFHATVLAACENTQLNWLVKLHPANLWKRSFEGDEGELAEITLLKTKGVWPLPNHVKLLLPDTDISTLSLYYNIDYGVTVRGTCGLELPCFGVPVITAGTGRYSGLGFTIDHDSKNEYLNTLLALHTQPVMSEKQQQLAKWHAYIIFKLRPWEFKSFRCTFGEQKNNNLLAYNLESRVTSLKEIKENVDLDNWADWVEDVDRPIDYINKNILSTLGV